LQKLITQKLSANSTKFFKKNKQLNMQKIKNSLLIVAVLMLASCGNNKPGDNAAVAAKKSELEKLKAQQTKINDEVTKAQADLAKLDTSSAIAEKAKLVTTATIAPSGFTHYIDLQGRVDAVNISNITPRGNAGQVKNLLIKKGDVVRKGQLLLQLDDVIAKQTLNASVQSLAATKAQLDLAKDLYKRRQNLWSQGIGTEVDVITAKTNAENMEAQYNAQQENLKNAQQQVNFSSVYSDVDGVADDVNIRVGEIFTGNNQIKIVNTNNLKVTTQIPENYLGRVKVGSHIIVTLPDINKTIDAVVTVASPLIDNNSRSFYIEAKIPANKDFHPNQIALVKIQDYNINNTITVPVNTLQNDDKGKFVMVAMQQNGKLIAIKRRVETGQFYNDKLEIKSGLKEGDTIIVDGFQGLYDGQLITTDGK
jgi:membrane fusion protein (multidrug efflux system)